MIIVFDFDKTLTYKDTSMGFYKSCSASCFRFYIKNIVYIPFSLLYKLNMISNSSLKKIALFLFLRGLTESKFDILSKSYSSKIRINTVIQKLLFHINENHSVFIITASFSSYVSQIFKDLPVTVIGTEPFFCKGKLRSLKNNCYGVNKVYSLGERDIKKLDVLYTDSYSDFPLMKISKKVFMVMSSKNKDFYVEELS